MNVIPPVYQFALLALISYRLWRVIAEDEVLEIPRRYLVNLSQSWEEGDPIPLNYRARLASFLVCAWCLGFWTSLLVYLGWMFTVGDYPHSTSQIVTAVGIWLAISCVVGIIRAKLDPPE